MDQYVMVPVAIKYGAAGVGASVLIGARQLDRRQPMRRRPAALRAVPC